VFIAFLVLQLVAAAAPAALYPDCSKDDIQALTSGLARIARGDERFAHDKPPRAVTGAPSPCDAIMISRAADAGWNEARALAPKGGAVDLLGPVHQRLQELEKLAPGRLSLETEYAQVVIRAEIAAAQDERPEMELLLTHARDLAERLAQRGRRAVWPRPFNLAAGELWLEVDRYEDARAAFERAVSFDGGAVARAGLGRALELLGRHEQACQAFRGVEDAAPALQDEARAFLARCP
jgi:tetratricopeptide (TPR) repeat protein